MRRHGIGQGPVHVENQAFVSVVEILHVADRAIGSIFGKGISSLTLRAAMGWESSVFLMFGSIRYVIATGFGTIPEKPVEMKGVS
jgi:hypothetical protein